jgi:hypothetical protein
MAAQAFEHRHDDVDFLATQVPAFAGVRVEAEHRHDRRGDAEVVLQRCMQDAQHALQPGLRDRLGDAAQRQVGRRQRHAHAVVSEHHHHIATRLLREQFGGAGVGNAAGIDGRLVHRAGDETVELAAQATLGGRAQCGDHGAGVAWIRRAESAGDRVRDLHEFDLARFGLDRVRCRENERDGERLRCLFERVAVAHQHEVGIPALAQGLQAQFRTDSGGLARHQREPGP